MTIKVGDRVHLYWDKMLVGTVWRVEDDNASIDWEPSHIPYNKGSRQQFYQLGALELYDGVKQAPDKH